MNPFISLVDINRSCPMMQSQLELLLGKRLLTDILYKFRNLSAYRTFRESLKNNPCEKGR